MTSDVIETLIYVTFITYRCMSRKEYTSLRIEAEKGLKARFNRLFPDKNHTETLELLLDNFSKVGCEGDKRAIWLSEETYAKLNKRGRVEDDWDDVILQLIEEEKVKPY